ncbi:hypothetical protein SVIOM74S_10508 [Streptomyces violarus]
MAASVASAGAPADGRRGAAVPPRSHHLVPLAGTGCRTRPARHPHPTPDRRPPPPQAGHSRSGDHTPHGPDRQRLSAGTARQARGGPDAGAVPSLSWSRCEAPGFPGQASPRTPRPLDPGRVGRASHRTLYRRPRHQGGPLTTPSPPAAPVSSARFPVSAVPATATRSGCRPPVGTGRPPVSSRVGGAHPGREGRRREGRALHEAHGRAEARGRHQAGEEQAGVDSKLRPTSGAWSRPAVPQAFRATRGRAVRAGRNAPGTLSRR